MTWTLIPWFRLEPWPLPLPFGLTLELQPFGALVAAGLFLGMPIVERRAVALGVSVTTARDFVFQTSVLGLLSAYLLNGVLYEPEKLAAIARDPSALFGTWLGLSSYGGFAGGIAAALWFARRRGVALVPLGDAWCRGLPFAWIFCRLGCFVVHDHPGLVSDFPLAVADYHGRGLPRHDLGLYEALWSVVCAGLFAWLDRRPRPAGFYLWLLPLCYGPIRFLLDFLRASAADGGDLRYGGLTPAQYASVALTVTGIVLWRRLGSPAIPVERAAPVR